MSKKKFSVDLDALGEAAAKSMNEERREMDDAPVRFKPQAGEAVQEVDPDKGDLGV